MTRNMEKPNTLTMSDRARNLAEQRRGMLFHVSPNKNRDSIQRLGIEPELFSQGKQKTAWYVESSRVMWALVHCAKRHGVDVFDLDVWIVPRSKFGKLSRTSMNGVYQSPCNIKTRLYMTAEKAEQKEAAWMELLG